VNSDDSVDVIYTHPGGHGWRPVERLAEIAARELEGRLVSYASPSKYSASLRARSLVPRISRGTRKLLLIASQPDHLNAALAWRPWMSRYAAVSAWVIDSFWHERIPYVARGSRFDNIYVTDPEDVDVWQTRTRARVSFLPWGTDSLSIMQNQQDRKIDLLRVGRQPREWDNDLETRTQAAAKGIKFAGRPPLGETAHEADQLLQTALSGTKYVLAFSNRVSPTSYTHPTHEYITGRWMDSLANGAVVAGIVPHTAAARELLWPEACLELGTTKRDVGLDIISRKIAQWTPHIAEINQREALARLDWRHRLESISRDLGVHSLILEASLGEIRSRLLRT
jgi:hypothetical protein